MTDIQKWGPDGSVPMALIHASCWQAVEKMCPGRLACWPCCCTSYGAFIRCAGGRCGNRGQERGPV